MDIITKALLEIKAVEEKFRKILENPALFTSENGGLSTQEHDLLKKLINLCGQVNIAGDIIIKKYSKYVTVKTTT